MDEEIEFESPFDAATTVEERTDILRDAVSHAAQAMIAMMGIITAASENLDAVMEEMEVHHAELLSLGKRVTFLEQMLLQGGEGE